MKIAIVTGASSGMGKEFVRQIERFYRELDEIWVIARSEKKLEEIKKNHKTYIRIFAGDMEEDLVYKQVKNRLENQNPDIRMLVNAAGFGKTGTVEEIAKEDRDDLYLSALDAQRDQDHQPGKRSGFLPAGKIRSLCGDKVVCTELFKEPCS